MLGIDYQKLVDIYVDVFKRPKPKGQIHGLTYGFKMFLSYTSELHFIFFIRFIFIIMFFYLVFIFLDPVLPTVAPHVPNTFCMCVCIFLVEHCLLMEGHIQHLGKVRLNSVIRSSSQSPKRKLFLSSAVQNLRSWGSHE